MRPVPSISIIIPTYGRVDLTRRCLESIHRESRPVACEILVVDDASPDEESRDFLRTLDEDPRIKVLRQPVNGGFAKACNRGIAESQSPFILLLNNDTIVQQGWLEPLIDAMQDPEVGAAGSLLLYPGGTLIQHAGVEFLREAGILKPFHIGQFQHIDSAPWASESRDVEATTGACLLFRRNALKDGTRLDECYRNGYEDIDFCMRLRKSGWRIRYCGASRIIHYESVAIGRFASENQNIHIFQRRWEGIQSSIPLHCAALALEDLRARRRYLGNPCPANAARVLRSAKRAGMRTEQQIWETLARGRFLPHRRISPDARQEIHRQLGIDHLHIRYR